MSDKNSSCGTVFSSNISLVWNCPSNAWIFKYLLLGIALHLGWKRRWRWSSPTINPALPRSPLIQVPRCHMNMSLNTSRDGDLITPLGSLFQCLTAFSVKKFLLISTLTFSCAYTHIYRQCFEEYNIKWRSTIQYPNPGLTDRPESGLSSSSSPV